MRYFKKSTLSFLAFLIFFGLSCDDRVPTSTSSAVESGSLSLSHVYITGPTSNPTIVGELLSDAPAEQKVSIVVIARLLDAAMGSMTSHYLFLLMTKLKVSGIPKIHQPNMFPILKNLAFQI